MRHANRVIIPPISKVSNHDIHRKHIRHSKLESGRESFARVEGKIGPTWRGSIFFSHTARHAGKVPIEVWGEEEEDPSTP